MRKVVLLFIALLFLQVSYGQLTGSYTIPGAPYATIAAAITDLNTLGVGSGGVTFNVTTGYTETFATPTAGLITTTTGSATNPIIFQKSGAGANPLVTAATGTGTYDYIFCIGGTDYITFDGIDVQENAANTTSAMQAEWAYAVLKASGTDGSQNVTIKNCNISLNKANTATYALYSNNRAYTAPGTTLTVTAVSGTNSYLKFFGNSITNTHNGIYLYGYASASPYPYYDQGNEIGKDGPNTITGLGNTSSTTTTYGMYLYYQNGMKIANNTFTGTCANTTGSLYNIYSMTGTNSDVDIYGNTISITYNGTGSFYGIYNSGMGSSGTSNTVNYYNNTITNTTIPNHTSGTVYFMYISTGGVTANFYGNTVSNCAVGSGTATSTGSIYYMYFSSTPNNPGTTNYYNNTISNNSRTQSTLGGGTNYILYTSGDGNVLNVYGNIVNNITTGSTGTTYVMYNLYSGTTKNVHDNSITNIQNANSTVYGLYNGNGSGSASYYRNKFQNITMAGGTGTLYGIYQSSGTNVSYYNNMVAELKAPTSANNPGIYGAYVSGGTAIGFYNNTIYLNAVSSGANFGVTGLYSSTSPTVDLRNNIVVNNSTFNGTGRIVAYQRSSTTLTTYAATSNNNDFWAGTPGANNLIYYDATNSDQTLAAYKTRVAPRDAATITENPPFVNVAASPYDLHLQTTAPTQCESGGVTVTAPVAVNTDYDGQNRYPNAGYPVGGFPPVAPDMGADEFGGLFLDLNPPTISYVPFLNTSSLLARTLTTSIADASGVPTAGTGLPRLYWRINSGAWSSVAGVYVSGDTYTFTFGAGVAMNDVVSYYIVAQDSYVPVPNVGANPSIGASGFTYSPPACSTPPTTPNTYAIVPLLCGTKTVGTGGDYTNLTDAFTAINNSEFSCPVTLLLLSTYSSAGETFPLVVNPNPGSSIVNTLTIKPNTGVTATITGANSGPILKILNPNTIIDGSNTTGGTTRDLTISNTSTTTPQVLVIGSTGITPITNVVTKNNILINGANTSSAVIISDGATAGTAGYFNDITIQNNSFQLAYIALYCIANVSPGNGSGLLITGNDFNTSGANSIRLVGIYAQGIDGATITDNNIGNIANTADASNLTGIWLATGTVNSLVSGNIINTISGTSTGPRGIAVSSGLTGSNVTVTGNTITTLTTSSSQIPYGIYVFSTTTGVMVTNNKVGGLLNTNTGGYGARGIYCATGIAASSINLINNLVYDIKCTGDASLTYWLIGIGIDGATGGVNVYHNSVNISGTYAGYTSATVSAAFYAGTSNVALDVRDNIFVNTYDNTGSSTDKSYAIYCATTNAAFTTIDYNDYFVSGTPGIFGYLGTDQTTLAAWKTATAQDAFSQNIDPIFVSATDLHPTNALLNNLGFWLPPVPTDYAGTIRTNPPDMGAYEFGADPIVNTTAATGITNMAATLNGTINAAGLTVNSFFDYGLTTAYGTSISGVPASVTGSTTTPINAPISGLTGNTTYHYRARGVAGALTIYGPDLTFTTLPDPPTVVTTAATGITATDAILNGTVNANGSSTAVTFEYGLTTAYGTTIPGVPGTVNGNSGTTITGPITGLLPNTLYHFRIIGVNAGGTAYGLDMTFTTSTMAPTVVTDPASNIGMTSAQLNGTVTANNSNTTVTFEWGLTTAYGNVAPATPGAVTGMTPTAVLANISGLITNTIYHYRCVGVSAGGTTYGLDQSFLSGCPPVGPAGAITGPNSVCANSTGQVYTVGAIVNATGYNWTVPAGATITAGQNTTSITVTFGTTSGDVSVYGTGPCGNGAPSSLPVSVNPLPVPTITGPAAACQGSTGNVYTTEAGMTGYTWSVSAGGTITAGAGTNAITVTWNASGAQSVSAGYTNGSGCTSVSPTTYNVTVNVAPVPTITGSTSMCVNSGFYNYSTQGGFSNYVWTISSGGTITFGQGTSQVQVTWNAPGAQWVAVNYSNANGCSAPAPVSLPVTVDPIPGAAGTITGTSAVCGGATGIAYSCAPVANATTYVWTLPAGASIASGLGTNSITVDFAANASSGDITVQGNNLCGNGTPSPAFPVTVTALPEAAGTITGQTAVCQATSGVIYTVPLIANATSYVWTVPAGATIVAGQTTATITVDFGLSAVSGDVTVYGTNSCGNGGTSALAVTVNPIPATPVISLDLNTLSSNAPAGNQWYYEGSLIPGATGQTYEATQSGWYWAVVTLNGCTSDTSNNIYVVITGVNELTNGTVNVYPVPNDGRFTVAIVSAKFAAFRISVYNNLGVLVREIPSLEVNGAIQQTIDLRPVPDGVYTIVIQGDAGRTIRKIVINK